MLNIAVCDDSRTDVEMLESAFDKLAQYQFSYEVYFTAKELLKHVIDDGEMYHLYIFDIEMPEMNGLQLAKEIRKIDAKALFVFLTGYTQYVMDVFEVITFDYISKPITVEKLESVLLKAMQYLHMIKRDFVFQFRKNQFRISCDDIVYFEKKGRQAVIHTISENFKANMTTEEIWKQLDDKVFAHIHVSYIINLGHIRAIEGDEVVMDNEERLLIARSHKQNLKEKHMEFVRRMEYVIRFAISLFDLAVFMYYFHSNKKMKPVSKVWIWAGFTIAAIIWTFVSNIKNPYLNLATLLIVLILLSFYYESGMWTRIINIVTFMGIGMLFEPVALLLLHAMNFHMGESYKYYFVMVICSFVRGNVMYILSKLISKKGMQIAAFPKEILGVLVMVFTFTVLNCCFIILLSLEAGSEKSLLMCASIVISLVLTDYFMLYMMERFNYLVQKQYEDAMYREEMHYKDIYYEEAEKQNKEVQKLKHDMKHKLHELYHLVENSDGHELSEKIGAMCMEFEQIDEKQYSDNPIVDSVLRIKFGRAKARGIKVETSIRIPKQMQLDHGDIGVLYGNLVDNAVEACSKVPEGQRFVKIENKYQSGILLLVITNSKTGKKNKSLKTTKKDNIRHGHGVQSVRKVVEKYNGTVSFTDKGDIFEVSAMLYGIEVKE